MHKSYIFWVNVISIVLGIALAIFLLVRPKDSKPKIEPTESEATEATEAAETEPTPTENKGNTTQPDTAQKDYPKIDEIEYYFKDGTYNGQPVVVLGYTNNSKYTVTSVQFYFKMKADLTQEERSLFDPLVNSGALTPEKLTKLSPDIVSEIVCDPGETGVGTPCTLASQTYATDVKQCQMLTLSGGTISFLGDDGKIYKVEYSAKNNTNTLKGGTAAKSSIAHYIPAPNTRFITLNNKDSANYQFTAYDMTYVQYQTYCSECSVAGFSKNVVVGDGSFTGTNSQGRTLKIMYHPEKQAVVVTATYSTGNTNKDPEQILEAAEKYILSFAPALSDQVVQYVLADGSKSVIYERTGGSIMPIPVWLPNIQSFSVDAITCQADIAKDLEEALRSIEEDANRGYSSNVVGITFEANVNGDILSILIKIQYGAGGAMGYHTYNFDVTTGKRLNNEALIEKLQITEFKERLTQTAKNGFETRWGPVSNTDAFKTQQLNATMTPENLEKTKLYVGADGKLMTVIYIYALAGAGGYYELVPFS